MTRQRTIALLLTAAAVLVTATVVATAQFPVRVVKPLPPGNPYIPPSPILMSVTVTKDLGGNEMSDAKSKNAHRIIRGWSDGTVDVTYVKFTGSVYPPVSPCKVAETCGPVVIVPKR